MKKEQLTLKNIKKDLKAKLKNTHISLVVFAVFFAVVLGIFLGIIDLGNLFFMYQALYGFLTVTLFVGMVIEIVSIIKLSSILKIKNTIVKDKLIGLEIKQHVNRTRVYETYHLYFSGYGEYVITGDQYKWSSVYALSEEGTYRYCDCGDEFYLVLSKPHTGKILLVYNTKLFELQESVCQEHFK